MFSAASPPQQNVVADASRARLVQGGSAFPKTMLKGQMAAGKPSFVEGTDISQMVLAFTRTAP